MKNIYLIVGPSGSGKTMVANRLEEKYRLKQVLSYTERPPRFEGEGGHTFVTPEKFDKLKNLCAYTVFDGHRYGASNPKTYALYGLQECCDVVFRNNFASVKGLEDEIPDLVYQYIKRQERV